MFVSFYGEWIYNWMYIISACILKNHERRDNLSIRDIYKTQLSETSKELDINFGWKRHILRLA